MLFYVRKCQHLYYDLALGQSIPHITAGYYGHKSNTIHAQVPLCPPDTHKRILRQAG